MLGKRNQHRQWAQGSEGVACWDELEDFFVWPEVRWERLGEGCGKMRQRGGQGPDPVGRGTE